MMAGITSAIMAKIRANSNSWPSSKKEEFRLFGELMQKLADTREGDHSLLEQTAIIMGSYLGNASSHNNSNLPIVVAGGHFQTWPASANSIGQIAAIVQSLCPPACSTSGCQRKNFASSTGTLTGLASI